MKILKGSAVYLNKIEGRTELSLDYLMLNLPFQCNYHCFKCCNRDRGIIRPQKYIGLTDRIKYIEKCKELGVRVLVMAGEGEPTLDNAFIKLVKFSAKLGLIPYIFTNGSQITSEMATLLATYNTSLIIHLDSFEAQNYDLYSGQKGAFKRLMKNLIAIRNVYQSLIHQIGEYKIVSLAINLVLNNENYDQIEKLKNFCEDDIVPVVNMAIKTGAAAKYWKKYNQTANLPLDNEVSYPLGSLPNETICRYLKNGISLGADGQILTCAYALDSADCYGNFRDDIYTIRQKVIHSVEEFYHTSGHSRCILRHPQYAEFINQLKLNRSK
jgi:MoaA/NifB/PqqE/SkfB family radical SAM enzyme